MSNMKKEYAFRATTEGERMIENRIGVIAGNMQQFKSFLIDISPKDREMFIYISSPHQVGGRELSGVIRIGTYYIDNPQHQALYDAAMSRVRV